MRSMRPFSIIVAATSNVFGIGRRGALPWKLAEDMAFFKRVTTTAASNMLNAVIMGRKTYESIPEKFRPLSDRVNVILSSDAELRTKLSLPDSVLVASSFDDALKQLSSAEYIHTVQDVFVIGGAAVYREALASKHCAKIYLTEVMNEIDDLDTFFPTIPAHKYRMTCRSKLHHNKDISFRFTEYANIADSDEFTNTDTAAAAAAPLPTPPAAARPGNKEEMQYLDIIREILDHGVLRGDRTGTGTLSKFGVQMRFSLRDNVFPLLTTKRVFWRGVAEELIWFVHGCTNGNTLAEKDIHIWDGNGSREFLDSRGLGHREVGDLGPVYGFQWRHFGAEYTDMHADYSGKGVDQLLDCIEKIKKTPEDRRIVLTAWNPADLDKMALPPCHMFCQFYVANDELSCQMYQRSADMGLGVPFNIASYSLLTAMVAQVCGLKCGDFVHTIGDAHVYVNHVDALREQLERTPRDFPKLFLNPEVSDIDKFQFSDFTIEGYKPDAAIKMKMAV